jgi:hypothetical protein
MEESEIEFFKTSDGKYQLDIKVVGDTVWVTQEQMTELFDKSKKTISEHINNVYKEGELEKNPTVRKFKTVQIEGKELVPMHLLL